MRGAARSTRCARISAARARELGLVTDVFANDEFDARVDAMAQQLANGPTRAFGVAKGLLNMAAGVDRLDHHLDQELENLSRIANSAEFNEGIAAFFDKRPPDFRPQGSEA
jgi:enoyl-CoA hydratase/carnithine racemase